MPDPQRKQLQSVTGILSFKIGLSTEVDNHSTQVINTVDTSCKFKYVLNNSCCGLRHSDSRFILKNVKNSSISRKTE